MKQLPVYSIKERQPKNGDSIFMLGTKDSFGDWFLDPQIIDVEYRWSIIDEDGYDSGDEEIYDAEKEMPSNCKLTLLGGSEEIESTTLYIKAEDMTSLFEDEPEND